MHACMSCLVVIQGELESPVQNLAVMYMLQAQADLHKPVQQCVL